MSIFVGVCFINSFSTLTDNGDGNRSVSVLCLHNFSKKAAIGSSSPLMEFASWNKLVSSLIDDARYLWRITRTHSQFLSIGWQQKAVCQTFGKKQNNCKTATCLKASETVMGSHKNRDTVYFIIALRRHCHLSGEFDNSSTSFLPPLTPPPTDPLL